MLTRLAEGEREGAQAVVAMDGLEFIDAAGLLALDRLGERTTRLQVRCARPIVVRLVELLDVRCLKVSTSR
jgi:hypothetical protein